MLKAKDFRKMARESLKGSWLLAVGAGLINGKSESTLAPKDNATRIEVAAILHRFMEENK